MLYNVKPAFAGFTFLKRFFSDRAMFIIYQARLRWPDPDPPRWRVWPACYSTSSQNSQSFIPANGLSFQLNLCAYYAPIHACRCPARVSVPIPSIKTRDTHRPQNEAIKNFQKKLRNSKVTYTFT